MALARSERQRGFVMDLKDRLEQAKQLFDGILQDVAAHDVFTPGHFRDRIYTKALKGLRLVNSENQKKGKKRK